MRWGSIGKVVAISVLLALTGCRWINRIGGSCHDKKPYMTAQSAPPLQVPAGLDADTSSAMKIPRLNEPAPPPRTGKDPCLDEPPSFVTPKTPAPQARSIMRPGEPLS